MCLCGKSERAKRCHGYKYNIKLVEKKSHNVPTGTFVFSVHAGLQQGARKKKNFQEQKVFTEHQSRQLGGTKKDVLLIEIIYR